MLQEIVSFWRLLWYLESPCLTVRCTVFCNFSCCHFMRKNNSLTDNSFSKSEIPYFTGYKNHLCERFRVPCSAIRTCTRPYTRVWDHRMKHYHILMKHSHISHRSSVSLSDSDPACGIRKQFKENKSGFIINGKFPNVILLHEIPNTADTYTACEWIPKEATAMSDH